MKMKDVMNLFHISEGTIRYYEKMGVIQPKRDQNNYRLFDFDSLFNLVVCKKYNNFGLSYKDSILSLKDGTLSENIDTLEKALENNARRLRKINALNLYYQNLISELKRFEREKICFVKKVDPLHFYELEKGDFENSIDAFKDSGISKWMNCMDISNFEIWGNIKKHGEIGWKRVLTVDTEISKLYSDYIPQNCNSLSEKQNYITYSIVPFHGMDQLNDEVVEMLCETEKKGYKVTGIIRARILMMASEKAYMKICVEIDDNDKTKVEE